MAKKKKSTKEHICRFDKLEGMYDKRPDTTVYVYVCSCGKRQEKEYFGHEPFRGW